MFGESASDDCGHPKTQFVEWKAFTDAPLVLTITSYEPPLSGQKKRHFLRWTMVWIRSRVSEVRVNAPAIPA